MNFIEDEAMDASSEESEEPAEMDYLDDYEAPTKRNNTIEDYDNEEDEEGEDQDGENNGNGENATTVVAARPADYSFQIGATPVGEEGSCYLAYNSTGYIHCSRDGTVVHFHDISHPAVPIMRKGILMGALSPVGAGFILSPLDTEDPLISDGLPRLSVYYRTFTALGAQSEWQAYLQPEETVRCMTTGLRYLAVATNRYLRLYSLSGVELAVLSKFPRIVTMVGTSSEKLMRSYRADFDPLAVCYMDGTELRVEVLDVLNRSSVVPSHTLPLTEVEDGGSHQLQWMGWSEDGPLHTVDTAGVVRMFTQSWGGTWVPVFDPRTSHDQSYNYWIWGVNDEVLLAFRSSRGDSPYPAAIASGLPSEHVRLYMPLTRTANEREMVTWDHVLRREIRTDEIKRHSQFYTESIARHDALHDKKILELFNAALKEQQTTRALDLATMLELRDNVEVCTKAANSAGQERLVHKLLALYEMRVKSKSKRKCPLPLEGTVASEKERDLLLRKLLKEKANGGAPSPSAAENPSITVEPKQQNETSLITGNSEPVARQQHVTFQQPIEKVVKSAPAVVAPKATKPLGHAMSSSTTRKEEAKVEQPVKKPSNPFSKATPAKTTTDIGLIGESQPAVAPAMNHNTTARQDTPTKPVDATADPASPSPTSRPSAASNAGPVTGGFTPKVLPVKAAPTPTATARSVSADPFLAEEGETMDETETTIQGILDVGHEESNYAPRTASFGEALRKRYREESDSDTEDLPIPVLPRVE
ncbi:Minichromosome loss protein, Mcl1, middle region containing protein, putative [Angomonas deanei]|uniref:Minichromosome loss protein, Mcl1, middle region containing protein, putative n=1 Tax=Angomonas deanei TaxID=59799 RepID=A0A7G2CJQ7_9TRYP|nr:Minichromosome loss protein, Mcl1, middle region containing protein, putative [Angomonas deanei]